MTSCQDVLINQSKRLTAKLPKYMQKHINFIDYGPPYKRGHYHSYTVEASIGGADVVIVAHTLAEVKEKLRAAIHT